MHRLSCPMACGIFPDQASNPCSLHRQVEPLALQGSPNFIKNFIWYMSNTILVPEIRPQWAIILSLNQISQNLLLAPAILVPGILKHHCHCVTLLLQNLELSLNSTSGGGKEPTCQCRRFKRRGFNPWVGKIPWKRSWQPIPIFLPGESHGQKSLVGYSP